jgi:hypothetical protein
MGCVSSSAAAASEPTGLMNGKPDQNTAVTTRTATYSSRDESAVNPKILGHSHSSIGLDEVMKQRETEGHLMSNVVHIESVDGRKIQEVYDGVKSGSKLGEGVAGTVHLVKHKATGIEYAVKCLELSRVGSSEETQEALRNEITIMSQV